MSATTTTRGSIGTVIYIYIHMFVLIAAVMAILAIPMNLQVSELLPK